MFLCAGHRFDYTTPIEETMQALHDVVKAGYVRYIGMSSCYAYQCTSQPPTHIRRADIAIFQKSTLCRVRTNPLPTVPRASIVLYTDYAINNNLTPFISMQNHHNLLYREEEREMFPTLQVRASSDPRGYTRLMTPIRCSASARSRGRHSPEALSPALWQRPRPLHEETLTRKHPFRTNPRPRS